MIEEEEISIQKQKEQLLKESGSTHHPKENTRRINPWQKRSRYRIATI